MKWIWMGVSLAEINKRTAESIEQNQTASMCSLILFLLSPEDKPKVTDRGIRIKQYLP